MDSQLEFIPAGKIEWRCGYCNDIGRPCRGWKAKLQGDALWAEWCYCYPSTDCPATKPEGWMDSYQRFCAEGRHMLLCWQEWLE